MKVCNSCSQPRSLNSFAKDKRNKDGLFGRCNNCINEARRNKYANDKDHQEKLKQRQKRYNGYANEKAKRHIEQISDTYVIAEIKRGTSLTTKDVRKHPELIEAKRQLIKHKRKLRSWELKQ